MSPNRFDPPSPEQIAKFERKQRAAEEGAQAMKEAANRAVAIRENMARLRELRLAKEAAEARVKIASAKC